MPRERKGFRDQLENIIAAHPQGEQMSVKEVAKYCGRDERTVAKQGQDGLYHTHDPCPGNGGR